MMHHNANQTQMWFRIVIYSLILWKLQFTHWLIGAVTWLMQFRSCRIFVLLDLAMYKLFGVKEDKWFLLVYHIKF